MMMMMMMTTTVIMTMTMMIIKTATSTTKAKLIFHWDFLPFCYKKINHGSYVDDRKGFTVD